MNTSGIIYMISINDSFFDNISIDNLFVFKLGQTNKGILKQDFNNKKVIPRLTGLQTSNIFLLDLYKTFFVIGDVSRIEKYLHRVLSAHDRIIHNRAEWFICHRNDVDEVELFIKNTIDYFNSGSKLEIREAGSYKSHDVLFKFGKFSGTYLSRMHTKEHFSWLLWLSTNSNFNGPKYYQSAARGRIAMAIVNKEEGMSALLDSPDNKTFQMYLKYMGYDAEGDTDDPQSGYRLCDAVEKANTN